MTRRPPLVPTLIVAAAVAVMIALGFWQLRRADEKQALLDRYRAAEGLPPVAFPTIPTASADLPLFRRATGHCLRVLDRRTAAGQNRRGETGFHGFHVIVGTIFLSVCLLRAYQGDFTPKQHFGFEAAAWYWHFVDVVWLFLFVSVYVWGGWGAPTHG